MFIASPLSRFIGTNFYNQPKTYLYNDAIYLCGLNHFDNQAGLYSKEGYLITNAAFFHKYPSETKGQALSINPAMAKNFPIIEEAYFAGHLHEQYGHVLTEFISRIWAYKQKNLKMPILVRTTIPLDSLFSFRWVQALLTLLELKRSDFLITSTPIKIRNLIVPDSLFAEQSYCYKHMIDFCHTLGDKAMTLLSDESIIKNSNIYLSRSKLVCGTILVDNEKKLEEELQQLGFIIIHPEDHSIAEQISFFRNNNIVTGIVGSAFHTSIFSPSPQGVAINMKLYPDINYLTMDGVNNASIDYVINNQVTVSKNPNNLYYETKTILNCKEFASDLFNLVQEKRRTFLVPNMGKNSVSYKPKITFYKIQCNNEKLVQIDTRNNLILIEENEYCNNVILVTLQLHDKSTLSFLIANSDTPLIIKYNFNSYLAIPVIIKNIDDQFFLCLKNTNEKFIVQSNQNVAYQTYSSIKFDYTVEQKEGLKLICSILTSIFDMNSYSNMEYYTMLYPDIVNTLFEIKNNINRNNVITFNNINNNFKSLSNVDNKKFLHGMMIIHISNIGDIAIKGNIDTGNLNNLPIESININLSSEQYSIKYSICDEQNQWTEWLNEGETAGTKGEMKALFGFSARIFDKNKKEISCICNVKFENDDIIHMFKGGELFTPQHKNKLVGIAIYL